MLRAAPCVAVAPTQNAQCKRTTLAAPARQMNTLRMAARIAPRAGRSALVVRAGAEDIQTVSETKEAFLVAYKRPIPAMFNTIIQELLVTQHLYMVNARYKYNALASLGFCSVFDQIFENYKWGDESAIFDAYYTSLGGVDSKTARTDSDNLLKAAKEAGSASALADLDAVKALKTQADDGKLLHNKFLAIGLFRVLEVGGYTDPDALKEAVAASGLKQEDVNRDLLTYKALLSKLNSAKEMQEEFIKRERKKTAEREAEKAAKVEKAAEVA